MSNRAHHRPRGPERAVDEQTIPAELQAAADTLNAWHAAFQELRPGRVSFRVQLTDVIHDGERTTGVQLWAMTSKGVDVHTIPPALARELAALLVDKAREAETGITRVASSIELEKGTVPAL